MSLLSIQNVSKRFGGLQALNDVCIEVQAGQITAVIGPNGAGKTTLFNAITGFHKADRGSVTFDGERIERLPPHLIAQRGLRRTFQLTKLFGQMTVLENVKVGCHMITRAETLDILCRRAFVREEEAMVEERAQAALAFVGLGSVAQVQAGILPHGQRRLLEIARIMVTQPKLALLDEPRTGLNNREVADLKKIIRRIVEQGTTVVLVEHDMGLVMELADNIHVLDYGQKIAEGAPAAIKQNQTVIAAYLGGEQ